MADALSSAAANGDFKGVKLIIDQGAQVNERSSQGFVPICIAAFWGYHKIVEFLLQSGANINESNSGTGWTALHCACFQGHGKVVMTLMEHQPDLTIKDSHGRTPVDFASALDTIWPFFAACGCKRTPKPDLVKMDIVQKVHTTDGCIASNERAHFSRPGSAYIIRSQPLYGSKKTHQEMMALDSGDVLIGSEERSVVSMTQHEVKPSFSVWNT